MIEQIQELYYQLEEKREFVKLVAKEVNRKPNTLKNHWFTQYWSIPNEHQEKVFELLKKTINKQTIPYKAVSNN